MAKRKIMVVDDNVTNLDIAKKILQENYDVMLIPSGEKALSIITKKVPDLILLDIWMPNMTGYQVIEKIAKLGPPYNEIPIIFLTSKTDENSEIVGLDLGAVDYIRKPFFAPVLMKRVQLHIEFTEQKKQLLGQQKIIQEHSYWLEDYITQLKSENLLNSIIIDWIEKLVYNKASMQEVLEMITKHYASASTNIFVSSKDNDNLKCIYSYSMNGTMLNIELVKFNIKELQDLYDQFEVNGIAYFNDVDCVIGNDVLSNVFENTNVKRFLLIPLFLQEKLVGFIVLEDDSKNKQDIVMLKNISRFIANEIIKNNR